MTGPERSGFEAASVGALAVFFFKPAAFISENLAALLRAAASLL